jgi:hypothetical protein
MFELQLVRRHMLQCVHRCVERGSERTVGVVRTVDSEDNCSG